MESSECDRHGKKKKFLGLFNLKADSRQDGLPIVRTFSSAESAESLGGGSGTTGGTSRAGDGGFRSGSFKRRRRISSGAFSQLSFNTLDSTSSRCVSQSSTASSFGSQLGTDCNSPTSDVSIAATLSGLAISDPRPVSGATVQAYAPEPAPVTCHRALCIPEIVSRIVDYLDCHTTIPHEAAPKRRKPMSLRHAILVHGDTPEARKAWERAQKEYESGRNGKDSMHKSGDLYSGTGVHSCLLVNSTWYSCAIEVLHRKIHFQSNSDWKKFATDGTRAPELRTDTLVLNKVTGAEQHEIASLGDIGGAIRWLEFYTCPNIVPTRALLRGGKMTKIVLPGCLRVDDHVIALIAQCCPKLEYLDVRACELVSDRGLKALAKWCKQLKLLNVGRTQNGDLITYKGVKHIARRTDISTLGLAGTAIDDRTIWELVRHRGNQLQRLSLNNCQYLTNQSIPHILGYTPQLSVLELRGCVQITNLQPVVHFKRYRERLGRPALIEGCELFEMRMKEAEWLVEMEASRQVFRDCLEWIYGHDDDLTPDQAGLVICQMSNDYEHDDE